MIRNLRAGFFILLLTVSVGIVLTNAIPLPNTPIFSLARFAWAGVTIVIIVGFIFFTSDVVQPEKTALGAPHFMPPPEEKAEEELAEMQLATRSYGKDITEFFFDMLGNLSNYLVRIRENVEILGDTPQLRITTHKLYHIGSNAPQVLLIPLVRAEKGTLFDDFTVTDGQGKIVPTLPHTRVRGLLALALNGLVETALRKSNPGGQAVNFEQRTRLTRELIKLIYGRPQSARRPEPNPQDETVAEEEEAAMEIDTILDSPTSPHIISDWRDRLRNFCTQYINNYVIVAEVCTNQGFTDNYITLTYSYRVPFATVATKKERWRRTFGLKPSRIEVPLNPFAFHVEAYHQEIIAEPGQYVFDHHLEWLHSQDAVKQHNLQTKNFKPYVRVYHADARPNAHLYIRRQIVSSSSSKSETPTANLKSVVEFHEIPPGTLGAATVIACASAAIISFFALTHTGLDINPNAPPAQADAEQIKATLNSDVPALLLALPAFVGVLIGSWLDLSHLRRASLTTYLALTMTMFLSLGSALYFVFDANHMLDTTFDMTIHGTGGTVITTDWIWLALMAVSITHFLFLLRMVIDLSRYYSTHVRKGIDKPAQFG